MPPACKRSVLTSIQFLSQCSNHVTKLPRQICIVKSRSAAGREQTKQIAFVRAFAQFIYYDQQAFHLAGLWELGCGLSSACVAVIMILDNAAHCYCPVGQSRSCMRVSSRSQELFDI